MTQEELTVFAVEPAGVSTVMSNTNRILRDGTYKVLGAKTGYNDMAGYCFAIAVSVDGRDLLIVTLGASGKFTRYGDVSRIVTWVQNKDKLAASNPTSAPK
jgi:D-alanyl-D-alanine carboxypeptidase